MQRIFLFFAVFCISVTSAFAQDVIILKNGDEVQALVQEIDTDVIKYKKFDNPNGPNYTFKKSEVFMIMYPNGNRDVFTDNAASQPSSTNQANVQNQVQNQEKNADFTLIKSSKIMIDVYGMVGGKKAIYGSLEKKLKELGFCCAYRKTDKNDDTASMVIIVHPNGPYTWGFRIVDRTLDKEIYFNAFAHVLTINHTVDKFINDIIPFIEK